MKVAIGIVVLAVLIVPSWFVLNSIFISSGSWTFSTVGQSDLPENNEGWCSATNELCFLPLPPCTYTQVAGELRSYYSVQHGIACYLWDYVAEDWEFIGSIQIPANSNSFHSFSYSIPNMDTTNHLLFTTSVSVNIDAQNGQLYYSECVGENVTGSIVFDQSTFYEGPFDQGTPYQLIAIVWCENTGTEVGTIYVKKFIDGAEVEFTWHENVQPGVPYNCCNFYWTIPDNAFTAGIKVWGEGESEPQWGDSNTHQWNVQVSPPLPDISITYTMTVLTFPSNCDVNLLGVGSMNSGDDGVALFEDVPYGSYDVTVSKTGYPTFTETVFMNDDIVISMDLNSQRYLIPVLFLLIVGIVIGLVVYYYKKKIIKF